MKYVPILNLLPGIKKEVHGLLKRTALIAYTHIWFRPYLGYVVQLSKEWWNSMKCRKSVKWVYNRFWPVHIYCSTIFMLFNKLTKEWWNAMKCRKSVKWVYKRFWLVHTSIVRQYLCCLTGERMVKCYKMSKKYQMMHTKGFDQYTHMLFDHIYVVEWVE